MHEFVKRLAERQKAEQLNGDQFAARIGISPAQWSRLKSGGTRPGVRLIHGALRVYPELAYFLASDFQKVNGNEAHLQDHADRQTEPAERQKERVPA